METASLKLSGCNIECKLMVANEVKVIAPRILVKEPLHTQNDTLEVATSVGRMNKSECR